MRIKMLDSLIVWNFIVFRVFIVFHCFWT